MSQGDRTDLEYCEECIKGKCQDHEWFTSCNPKTEKDILVAFLKRVGKHLPMVFEKVYQAEAVIHDQYEKVTTGGQLTFDFYDIPTVHKKDERYIPLTGYSFSEGIIKYDITIEVTLIRHHPTELIVRKGVFPQEEVYRADIINFDDCLHCESISDYREIVDMATLRLCELIGKIEHENSS